MILDAPSLLITDDDRDLRETLRSVFECRGYRTVLAENGEEAVEIVRHEQIHVALLDMHMPRLTGLEAIRRVKQVCAIVPCILISAELTEALAEKARQAEVFSALSKPLSVPKVTQTVSLALRQVYDWPAT